MRSFLLVLLMAALLPNLPRVTGCGPHRPVLRILAADALGHALRRVVRDFRTLHPDQEITVECQGSVTLCRMASLRPCDLLLVADDRLVERFLGKGDADWVIPFATSRLVLAFGDASVGAAEVTSSSWPEVLLRPGVIVGLADPRYDPCGYFTKISWTLAESHHGMPGLAARLDGARPPGALAADALQLLTRLETRAIDYAFVYACLAHDLHVPHVELAREINLGDPHRIASYERIEVAAPGAPGGQDVRHRGTLIRFGATIPRSARTPRVAEAFLRHLVSPRGRALLATSGLDPIESPLPRRWGAVPPPDLRRGAEPAAPSSQGARGDGSGRGPDPGRTRF